MLDTLRTAQHVLKTNKENWEVISFNKKNEVMARFKYDSRQGAIKALERLTGRKVTLRPMVTPDAERVETQHELEDVNTPDE